MSTHETPNTPAAPVALGSGDLPKFHPYTGSPIVPVDPCFDGLFRPEKGTTEPSSSFKIQLVESKPRRGLNEDTQEMDLTELDQDSNGHPAIDTSFPVQYEVSAVDDTLAFKPFRGYQHGAPRRSIEASAATSLPIDATLVDINRRSRGIGSPTSHRRPGKNRLSRATLATAAALFGLAVGVGLVHQGGASENGPSADPTERGVVGPSTQPNTIVLPGPTKTIIKIIKQNIDNNPVVPVANVRSLPPNPEVTITVTAFPSAEASGSSGPTSIPTGVASPTAGSSQSPTPAPTGSSSAGPSSGSPSASPSSSEIFPTPVSGTGDGSSTSPSAS